jgi:hypothetical protein
MVEYEVGREVDAVLCCTVLYYSGATVRSSDGPVLAR